MATGRQSHPRSISPAVKSTKTRGKEGVSEKRRGTLHILVSLADSCSSLVQASLEGPTPQPARSPQDAPGATCRRQQPASQRAFALAGLPLAPRPPITRRPAQGRGSLISIKLWSPRSVSNCGPSPRQIPHFWLSFHTLTAQPPLTSCENTTKDN